ncbi:hypothetical protein UY3_03805 [Chelonia mydas]|uniref:Uncharacterized protein n=1 Tax=Chelonia mydas TaxID=8469 RepID=M7CDU4_CHEMY|nr:hypothetical protein UY3_03805 [Chelonia mydas]
MVVEDPTALASSSSSPDEAIMGPPSPVPPDDAKAHQELLKRVAANLGLKAEELEEPLDSLFDVLCSTAPARVALPLHEGVSKITNALWQTLSSLPPISKRTERKYFVLSKGHEYLYTHLAPNFLVWRVANHQALLGCRDFNMWQAMAKFEGSLPEASRKEFWAIIEEGTTVARATLQAVADAAVTAAQTMASAVAMCQASWLLLSGLSMEAHQSMQDLPFSGKAPFAEQTDNKFHGLKDFCMTLKTLGLYIPGPAHKRFKPQQP